MIILDIPLSNVPAQRFHISLAGRKCSLSLYTRAQRLFMDLDLAGQRILTGAACLNHVPVMQLASRALPGQFIFSDTRGFDHPHWSGLGQRWKLVYITE